MSLKDVQTKLEAAGYTDFREIEREKNKYEVKATDPQGQRVELDVDPVTGDVLKTEVKRSKYALTRGGDGTAGAPSSMPAARELPP